LGQRVYLLPKEPRILLPIPGHRFPVCRTGAVAECLARGRHEHATRLAGVIFNLSKRTTDAVIPKMKFLPGVGYPEIPNPG
jgi:hypothetical protein